MKVLLGLEDGELSSEIELLQKTNESQQITLNSLNTTLHYIIQNLKLSGPLSFTQTDVNSDINSDINSVNVVGYSDETEIITGDGDGDENIYSSMIVDGSTGPDFPDSGKSVIINEVANEIREFTPSTSKSPPGSATPAVHLSLTTGMASDIFSRALSASRR